MEPAPSPEQSPAVFAAAVQHLAGRAQAPVRVDPRPLHPDAALNSVQERDLLVNETDVIRMRERVIERAGWTRGNAVEDWSCVFSQGLPPARPQVVPDTLRARREACLRNGPYESLVLGLPRPGNDPGHPRRSRIRALRMLTYGYEVIDLFLEQSADGAWSVVAQERRSGVMS